MTVIIVLNNTSYQPDKISDATMTASPPHTQGTPAERFRVSLEGICCSCFAIKLNLMPSVLQVQVGRKQELRGGGGSITLVFYIQYTLAVIK